MTALHRIVAAIGGTLYDNGRRALVPGPGHSARDRSVSLTLTRSGTVLVHCFSPADDWRTVRDHLRARGLLDPDNAHSLTTPALDACGDASGDAGGNARAGAAARAARVRRARHTWAQGRAIAGTPAERYLRNRAITGPLDTPSLRFHPAAASLEDRLRRPALLAALTDPAGAVQGVQVTLLTPRGDRAALAIPRRVVGRLTGCAVRLDTPSHGALVLAEGVETALSAKMALGHPTWAALSAWNLAHFACPAEIERLVIAADNDAPGMAAAGALRDAARAARPTLVATVEPPPRPFGNWNDWAERASHRTD